MALLSEALLFREQEGVKLLEWIAASPLQATSFFAMMAPPPDLVDQLTRTKHSPDRAEAKKVTSRKPAEAQSATLILSPAVAAAALSVGAVRVG